MSEADRIVFSRSTREALRAVLLRVQESPERLSEILESAPEALVAFDADRRIRHANERAETLFGYGRGQLAGRPTDELVPPRLRQPDPPPMMVTDDLMQVDLPGLMQDGAERPIEWCFGAARCSAGHLFVMSVRDRQEADLALEALRASEERFDLIVNGVRDCAIFMLDPEGRVTTWNTGAFQIKGWRADEVVGRPYEMFYPEEDRAAGRPARHLAAAIEAGVHESTGWRLRKDGSRFWAHASITALRARSGELRGFAKITRDLTVQLRAEENERRLIAERAAREAAQEGERRVRDSEDRLARLQRVTAALSEALTPHDVGAVVLRECLDAVGAAGGSVYLLSADGTHLEMLDQRGHPQGVVAAHTKTPLDVRTPLADCARTHTASFFESREACIERYPALRAPFEAVALEAAAALPLVVHGELLGAIGVRFAERRVFEPADRAFLLTMSDLCGQALDRARLFAAERSARAAAEAANRSKDEFMAMLGHELRNPLAPIATAVQVMKLSGDDRTARERDVIERQVVHIGRLVDDLLDVSRIANGRISLARAPVSVREVLEKSVEMASPLLEQRGQRLEVDHGPDVSFVDGDAMRLAQVVSNILANAAKYTPRGGHIQLSAAREGDEVVVRVRDDGDGIGADLLPVVFDRFVQGERTLDRAQGGLGLGLALVKSLVTLHGGTVAAASDGPGKGSEFVVRLPALDATGSARDVPSPKSDAAAPGKRILVVDDNEDAGDMLSCMLQMLGHEVELAHDGPEALRRLETFHPDVAILDIGLPVMDGYELARHVIAQMGAVRPRLIALTGYGRERDIAAARAAGFDVHLVKPVDTDALTAAIQAEGGAGAPGRPPAPR